MVERGEAVNTLSSQQLEQLWAEDLKGELETKGKWPLRSCCPEEMDTERHFAGALEQVRSWRILGDHLELFDSDGSLLARLEARASK